MNTDSGKRLVALLLALSLTGCSAAPAVPSMDEGANQSNESKVEEVIPTLEEIPEEEIIADAVEKLDEADPALGMIELNEESDDTDGVEDSTIEGEEESLDDAQKNSIAMLNYLAFLSQEINSSKNSRLFLEEAYSSLINNTNPERVNELTESHLSSLLDIIERYRMIAVKRDRLQQIYNQNKAKALKEAVPNPVGLLSAVSSGNLIKAAASSIYMAVDSVSSYNAYNESIDQAFLQDGWSLDDEEAENLHDSRKRAFMFMVEIVRQENLPGDLALSEKSVEKFVSWKNNTNIHQKLQFLESEEATYGSFGHYWLELADCYYQNGQYEKCLEAMSEYESRQTSIFRKDYYYAQMLPKAIAAASEVYDEGQYIAAADRYAALLISNTEDTDWALRYFAAEVYLDLYSRTKEPSYVVNNAYTILLNNVNNLVKEQEGMNKTYLSEVQQLSISDDDSKEEKKRIKDYNKELKENRKTELPPVYEPLTLNCELLFTLVGEFEISDAEKNKINGILNGAFLSVPLQTAYSFDRNMGNCDAEYDKDSITIPAIYVSENAFVKATVSGNGESVVYDDWTVKSVKRTEESVDSFAVTYTSKSAAKYSWSADSLVIVEIADTELANCSPVTIEFKVSKYKDNKLLPDTIEFEQVN